MVKQVTQALSEFYGPEEAERWLREPHRLLNGRRPIDAIAEGDTASVLALIAQLRDGAYI